MIEIDIIVGSKYESPWRDGMICTSVPVLIVAKSVLTNRVIDLGIMTWSVQLQSNGGEYL